MSYVHTTADPSVYPASDWHPRTTHSQCYCSHPQHSVPTCSVPFHCGEAAATEDIQRLTHRASFAESAFYAVLHSNALKDKDHPAETAKIDNVAESVEALAQQSLRLSQDAKAAGIQLSERLDASIQIMTHSQEGHEMKLKESQETVKRFIERIRAELQDDRAQLLEDVKHQIRQASAEEREPDDSWALHQMLSEREAELRQAKEDLRIARIDHANAEIMSDLRKRESDSLKSELASINEAQTSLAKEEKEIKLESRKVAFAIRQMLKGRYALDEWTEQAPKDLFPFNFGDELISLGRKLSEACKVHNSTTGAQRFGLGKPESFQAYSLNGDDMGPFDENHTTSLKEPASNDRDDSAADAFPVVRPGFDVSSPTLYPALGVINLPASGNALGHPVPSSPGGTASNTMSSTQLSTLSAIAVTTARPSAKVQERARLRNRPRIGFNAGEIITDVVACEEPGHWLGTNAAGERGWFKRKTVQLR